MLKKKIMSDYDLVKEKEKLDQIDDLNLQLVKKMSDPEIRLILINIHRLIYGYTIRNLVYMTRMGETLISVTGNLQKQIIELKKAAPPDLVKKINEIESVIDEELTNITEIVELLREIYADEAENLEKLR